MRMTISLTIDTIRFAPKHKKGRIMSPDVVEQHVSGITVGEAGRPDLVAPAPSRH